MLQSVLLSRVQSGDRLMQEECDIGCMARAQVKGRRAVVGPIVGTSHNGTCWVLRTGRGEQAYHKSHCQRIDPSEAGIKARGHRREEKGRLSAEGRAVLRSGQGDGD